VDLRSSSGGAIVEFSQVHSPPRSRTTEVIAPRGFLERPAEPHGGRSCAAGLERGRIADVRKMRGQPLVILFGQEAKKLFEGISGSLEVPDASAMFGGEYGGVMTVGL
jgi:hypothetical protein